MLCIKNGKYQHFLYHFTQIPTKLCESIDLWVIISAFYYAATASLAEMANLSLATQQAMESDCLAIRFTNISEIVPSLLRFVTACGPLSDLNVAKSSLAEALAQVEGDLSKLRAPNVEFTALEWVAKKGNAETVH